MAEVDVASSTAVASPVPATPEPASKEPESIAAHAEALKSGSDPDVSADDNAPLDDVVDTDAQQRQRGSRAKSKQAAARINRLSAQNYELKQRLEAIERSQQRPAPQTPRVAYQVPTPPSGEFREPEPQLAQFADHEDPYGAHQRALARWDRRRDEFEAGRTHQQGHVQQLTRQQEAHWQGVFASHDQELRATIAARPELQQAFARIAPQSEGLPLLNHAIAVDRDGVAMAVYLATHPQVFDEFALLTAPQPVTERTVAITRRLLRQRMSAGATGSVAPAPLSPAPRPPNPVRTAPMRTTADPPGEGASIADHAKFYAPKS